MPGMWQKTMVYLGLKDDEEGYEYDYDELDLVDEPDASYDRRPERRERESVTVGVVPPPPVQTQPRVRAVRMDEASPRDLATSTIRPVPATSARVHVVEPHGFNDAQEVGDRLKADQPVIVNLQGLGRDLQRRLIDFASGLTYAVGGTMARVADQVFLLTPSDVEVSQEEKERLQARGLYRA
ncbi:MAG: cell division protein SepF [Actinobacteria bacterium]|nr:cell division protein SepF [Actinomycetota bacterium]